MPINWSDYSRFIFIDSNVALECLALEQLPWRELDTTGPILVLVAPTVITEVDSKKHHARQGDHARRFNRTLRALLAGAATHVLREGPAPRVELAIAHCEAIPWCQYPDLDRSEGDARVIAEVLHAVGPDRARSVVVSHDILPLYLAKKYGLATYPIGDKWLGPKEISECEKMLAKLQKEFDAYKAREPQLAIELSASASEIKTVRVQPLTDEQRHGIMATIMALRSSAKIPDHAPMRSAAIPTLGGKRREWMEKHIPAFVGQYERKLELAVGQFEIRFTIANCGNVQADHLQIRIHVSGGWVNRCYVGVSPSGPTPPADSELGWAGPPYDVPTVPPLPGPHAFTFSHAPTRSDYVELTCADFRSGQQYECTLIGWADPGADTFRLEAVATAANLYDGVHAVLAVPVHAESVTAGQVADLDTLKFRTQPESWRRTVTALLERRFDDVEWDE